MPLPEPNSGESRDDFVDRCMSDAEMVNEFDDDEQRQAVCVALWNQRSATPAMEFHTIAPDLELRAGEGDTSDGQGLPTIVGHAAVFDSWSEDLGGWRERISTSAFDRALAERQEVASLFNHNRDLILGRTANDTLSLEKRKKGLWTRTIPADTTTARDVVKLVERGDLLGMSFAFRVPIGGNEWSWNSTRGIHERQINDVDLFDVSPVTDPAFARTNVSLRAFQDAKRLLAKPRDEQKRLMEQRFRLAEAMRRRHN